MITRPVISGVCRYAQKNTYGCERLNSQPLLVEGNGPVLFGMMKAARQSKPQQMKLSPPPNIPVYTPEDVVSTIAAQDTNGVTVEGINRVAQQLKSVFPGKIKSTEAALGLLKELSQFGNMDSLNALEGYLLNQKQKIWADVNGTLAGTLAYLEEKARFENKHRTPQSPFRAKPILNSQNVAGAHKVYLVDPQSPVFQPGSTAVEDLKKAVKSAKAILLYPKYWLEGVTAFDELSENSLYEKAAAVINSHPFHQVKPVMDGLGFQKPKVVENTTPFARSTTLPDQILSQLSSPKMTSQQLGRELNGYGQTSQTQKNLLLFMLQRSMQVFDERRLATLSKQLNQRIMDLANQKQIAPDKIYYYIPETISPKGIRDYKSHGIATMLYTRACGVRASQVITEKSQIAALPQNSMLVVLDDLAGSGGSLKKLYADIKKVRFKPGAPGRLIQSTSAQNPYKGTVVVAPLVSTKQASDLFAEIKRQLGQHQAAERDKLEFIYGVQVPSFIKLPDYIQLPQTSKIDLDSVMGSKGYGGQALNVVFSHMSPNNNNQFFADNIAGYYTLNGEGVKKA